MDIKSLDRFVNAQTNTYQVALNEIKNGRKRSHWMWFMFPQLQELGMSSISRYYGISGLEEAKAYLEHPILSERLYELCGALLEHKGKRALEIFGAIDSMKLQSSMTLFALAFEERSVFEEVLECFFDGLMDEATLELLNLTDHVTQADDVVVSGRVQDVDEACAEVVEDLNKTYT